MITLFLAVGIWRRCDGFDWVGSDWIGLSKHCIGFGVSSVNTDVILLIPFCQSISFEALSLDQNNRNFMVDGD